MRSFPAALTRDGSYITPFELNTELGEISAVGNSLDVHNFGVEEIDSDKLESGACGDLLIDEITSTNIQTSTNDRTLKPVLNGNDEPWLQEFESGDGLLRVATSGWLSMTPNASLIWIGVRVDGKVVATQQLTAALSNAWRIEGDIAVGAGVHVVDVVWQGPAASGFLLAYTNDYEWKDRILTVREVAR